MKKYLLLTIGLICMKSYSSTSQPVFDSDTINIMNLMIDCANNPYNTHNQMCLKIARDVTALIPAPTGFHPHPTQHLEAIKNAHFPADSDWATRNEHTTKKVFAMLRTMYNHILHTNNNDQLAKDNKALTTKNKQLKDALSELSRKTNDLATTASNTYRALK